MRQRLICVDSSAPAAPALGRPVAPAGAGAGEAEKNQGPHGLELLDVVVVVGEKGAGRLDVARPRELELEPDALLVALAAELVHLLAQGLGALGGLALELGDARVALRERRLIVLACLGSAVVGPEGRGGIIAPLTCVGAPSGSCVALSPTCCASSCKPSICPSFP